MVNVLPVPTALTAPHCPHQLPGCLVTDHSLHKPSAPWAPSLQGPHPRARWAPSLHPECTRGGGGDTTVTGFTQLMVSPRPVDPGPRELWPHTDPHPEPPSRSQHREPGTPGLARGEEGERVTRPIARPVELWGGGGLAGAPREGRRGAAGGKAPEWAGAPPGPAQGGLRGRAPHSLEPPESPGKRPEGTVGWGAPTARATPGHGVLKAQGDVLQGLEVAASLGPGARGTSEPFVSLAARATPDSWSSPPWACADPGDRTCRPQRPP